MGNLNSDFRGRFHKLSDNELKKVLRKRNSYQAEAVEEAIKEAMERGMINNEQDLFSDDFAEVIPGKKFFPDIENEKAKNKLIKSILRSFLLFGSIPLVWGIIQIIENKKTGEGLLVTILAIVWMGTCLYIRKKRTKKPIGILFLILLGALIYIGQQMIQLQGLSILDHVIFIVSFGLLGYGIFYLRKLL